MSVFVSVWAFEVCYFIATRKCAIIVYFYNPLLLTREHTSMHRN